MNAGQDLHTQLDRIQKRSLITGVLILVPCFAMWLLRPDQFLRSYLLAYLFWIGIFLGCFAIVMLHHLVGGGWGFVIQRLLESGTRTFPLMILLAVPLFFGIDDLYAWARPEHVTPDQILQHKSHYLNIPFFRIRMLLYFAAWSVLAYFLNKFSVEQDRTADPSQTRRLQIMSGPGLVLYGLTVSFASIDWVMSLEPHWFSTVYGAMFMVGQVLSTLAFVTVFLALLSDRKPLSDVVSPAHFHDLGNLLLAFVMLWAYIAFSQYLIIWSGNLKEEVSWYLHRINGGWEWIALFLILFHFALPFLLLLSRGAKRRARMLLNVAAAMLFMRLVDLFWIVVPAFHPAEIRVHWLDLAAPIGMGGIWIAVFVRQLKGRSLLPLHDPRLERAFGHSGVVEHG